MNSPNQDERWESIHRGPGHYVDGTRGRPDGIASQQRRLAQHALLRQLVLHRAAAPAAGLLLLSVLHGIFVDHNK